ncbi:MAG: hypothetical protein JWN96_3976 [Mycobacterium sp.]|nr:hypothetical protein [Mycobacterium sp.]
MHSLAGPFAAFALLLILAGVAKAVRPLPTVRALRSVNLPSSKVAVRLLGAGESALALVALFASGRIVGSITAALVAVSYASFAAFVFYARARGGTISSCGCFGKADSPPTAAHIVVNLVAAGVAGVAAGRPGRSPLAELAHSPGAGVPLTALVLVTTGLAYLALAEWPTLAGVLREGEARA